jgi:hypothetical protein
MRLGTQDRFPASNTAGPIGTPWEVNQRGSGQTIVGRPRSVEIVVGSTIAVVAVGVATQCRRGPEGHRRARRERFTAVHL